MTLLDKLSFLLPHLPRLATAGGFELVLAIWVVRTWSSSTATLWPSRFGDNSALAFFREDEPREYWTLFVLGCGALSVGTAILIDRIADLLG